METIALQQHHHHHVQPTVAAAASENWLYEIKQKGQDSTNTCYVMVQNVKDLVKSHLMFAVREEVEVLKEKISELMDRINQLEYENGILKANASQETLSQLTPTSVVTSSSVAAAAAANSASATASTQSASTAASASSAPSSAAKVPSAGSQQQQSSANPSSNGSVS